MAERSETAVRQVESLVMLACVATGTLAVAEHTLDLRSVVHAAIERSRTNGRGRFIVEPVGELRPVRTDPTVVFGLLVGLLDHACAVAGGAVRITMREATPTDGTRLRHMVVQLRYRRRAEAGPVGGERSCDPAGAHAAMIDVTARALGGGLRTYARDTVVVTELLLPRAGDDQPASTGRV